MVSLIQWMYILSTENTKVEWFSKMLDVEQRVLLVTGHKVQTHTAGVHRFLIFGGEAGLI